MAKFAISGQNPQSDIGTKKGWYQYPLDRGKVVSVPIHQKRVGTGTNQSGTGTDVFNSPDFRTLALLSPEFVHRYYRNP